MNHIIISGSPRSGKTTLSRLIKKERPVYNVFHGDIIRYAITSIFGKDDAFSLTHTNDYEKTMVDIISQTISISQSPYIFEWSRLFPSELTKLKEDYEIQVICLGHGGISAEELFVQCRKYETAGDYTVELSDNELLMACKRWVGVDM